jgi:hypothetical protein
LTKNCFPLAVEITKNAASFMGMDDWRKNLTENQTLVTHTEDKCKCL